MSGTLTEFVQRLVLMEADLARLLDQQQASGEPSADHFPELMASMIAIQRQAIETLVAAADEIAGLKAAMNGVTAAG
ncbi:MAG: hypothetical protein ACJ71Z_06925 [Aeromicrobium sp.]